MKLTFLLACICSVTLLSCGSQPSQKEDQPATEEAAFVPPPPGTVVASAATVIKDGLNDFDFKVRVETNEHTKKGTYTIFVTYGPNENSSMFTLPRGGEQLPISIRKGDEYEYIIGFTYQGKFYEYYQVSFVPGHPPTTSVKNIKAWALQ
jgi:hypothetical protein